MDGVVVGLPTIARTLFDTDVVSKWDLRGGSRMLVVARPRNVWAATTACARVERVWAAS